MGGGPADSFGSGHWEIAERTIITEGTGLWPPCHRPGSPDPTRQRRVRHGEVLSHVGSGDSHCRGTWSTHLGSQLGAPRCSVIRNLLKATRPMGGGALVARRLACPHTGGQALGSEVSSGRCCHQWTFGAGALLLVLGLVIGACVFAYSAVNLRLVYTLLHVTHLDLQPDLLSGLDVVRTTPLLIAARFLTRAQSQPRRAA